MKYEMSRLKPLAQQAIEHWREFLPSQYKQLKANGTLNQEALQAAEMTLDAMATLVEQGMPAEAAWEMVREQYLFKPEEAGASEEAPDSQGYKLNQDLNQMMSQL